jgi:hypothetical protein
MELTDALGTYDPMFMKAFLLSAVLFLLYSIINLIDINGYIKNYNILDVDSVSRGTMVYAYMSGYFMFVLKVVIALVTLFILTLIIRIAVATVIRIFTPKKQSGGASIIMQGAASDMTNKVAEAVTSNMRYLLAFITSPSFIVIFLVIVPIFLFFALLGYSRFYNQEHIKQENSNEAPRIMTTHHNFLLFLISSLFTIGFIFTVYLWFKITYKK